jgi:hypothetical protein
MHQADPIFVYQRGVGRAAPDAAGLFQSQAVNAEMACSGVDECSSCDYITLAVGCSGVADFPSCDYTTPA